MVCLGLEPSEAEWKLMTIPQSYGGTHILFLSINSQIQFDHSSGIFLHKNLSDVGDWTLLAALMKVAFVRVQCDQMTKLCFQYLAICSSKNLPQSI